MHRSDIIGLVIIGLLCFLPFIALSVAVEFNWLVAPQ